MPATTIQFQYARWLQGAPTEGLLITVAEFFWGVDSYYWVANHIENPTTFILENGWAPSVVPYPFTVSQPERSNSTDQTIQFSGPCQGGLISLFERLRGTEINFRIRLTIRYFLWPNMLNSPLSIVPERYYVTSITYNRTNIAIDASTPRLPRKLAGTPYTVEEYPGLLEF